jgi:hypothetical protein
LQEALGSSESEPAAARPRGKRARAAEVHNLSEKVSACPLLDLAQTSAVDCFDISRLGWVG